MFGALACSSVPPGRLARRARWVFVRSGYGALAAGVSRFELVESLFELPNLLLELLLRDCLRLLGISLLCATTGCTLQASAM